MKPVRLAVLAAAAALAVPQADAQHMSRAQLVPAAPLIAEFGACAARQLPGQARALMATAIDSPQERRIARAMARSRGGCVDRRLRSLSMRVGEFRGGVAEALLEQDPAAMARLAAMPATAPVRPEPADGRAFVAAYARCIADADPARAAALLGVERVGPAQRGAFLAFGDTLTGCMPIGQRYAIDQVDVRNHIAVRLFDIAYR